MHKSVLLQSVVEALDLKAGDVFVDGTLGEGGHSLEIAKMFGTAVKIIGIDIDRTQIEATKDRFKKDGLEIETMESMRLTRY